MTMSGGSRLAGIALLALVVAGAVLLVAGYGVPVGVGLLAGLILGWMVGLVSAVWLAGGASGGRSFQIGPWRASSDGPPIAEIQRYSRALERVAGVEISPVRRVLLVAQSMEASGVRLELGALEIHEDGGLVSLIARTSPPLGPLGPFAEVVVEDDFGSRYLAAGTMLNGSGPTGRHEIRFAPAPPEAATRLTIRIDHFADPFRRAPDESGKVAGPWEFRVPLGER